MKSEWFETFFQGPAVEFWTRAMPAHVTGLEVDFLAKTFPPGARVLDVPCGNGRHALDLARRGYRVTGVDISDEFLTAARASSADGAEFLKGDMRDLQVQGPFQGAYCLGNSFGYLNHDQAPATLKRLSELLDPGSALVLDTGVAAESILPTLPPKRWHKLGDLYVLSEAKYVPEASRIDIDYTFIDGDRIETRPSTSYVLTIREIIQMLRNAGFADIHLNGGFAGEPYQVGTPRLVVTARKSDTQGDV